jgi:glycosyltransferase involved in cell wall biosynthesis
LPADSRTGATELMRVLFLTHNYPRHPGDVAGAFLHPLAVALRQRGVDVRVIAPSDRGEAGEAELDGVPVRRVRYAIAKHETLAYTGNMAGALRSISGIRAFTGMLEAFRREVHAELHGMSDALVHAHWWIPAGAAVPPGYRHLITCHGTDVRLLDGALPFRWVGSRVLRRATMVTTVSPTLAGVIARRTGRTLPDDQVQPMPVADIPRPRSTGGGGIVVLGRLSAQKRVDLALAGYAEARRRGVTTPMVIVGEGTIRHELEQQARTMGLEPHVQFRGAVTPNAVPGVLAAADCLLMPAKAEGLGLAAAEALMQGVPVIACDDGGGVLDVVPREGGGRVVRPTAEGIADGIIAVMADEGAGEAALRSGLAWRDMLSPDHVADRCLDWYRRVLAA